MGKKYLDTKEGSLESSVLGVWQTAIEEGDARMDGRTKEYREHRKKLESARTRREEKKVNKEEVEIDEVNLEFSDEEIDLFELDDEMFEAVMKKKSAADRMKAKKKKDKWKKTSGGKKSALKSKKRADKVRKGTVRVDKSKSKVAKKRAKIYAGDDVELDEGKMKELHGYIEDGKSAEWIAKKMGVDVKTIKALMKETIDEGTWALPKTPKQKAALKKLLSKPLKAKDASDKIYDIIGDDQLADDLDDLASSDPNDDARDLVRSHMKRLGIKEEVELDEASGDKEAYQKFFNAALKKFKVSSPAEFKSDEEKKKFYDYIDKNWEGDDEKAEQVKEFKIQSMKDALAQIWGVEEGKNPFAEHKGTKPHKHPHDEDQDEEHEKKTKTETGKKPAAIDLKPKIDD